MKTDNWFLNKVILIETNYTPAELLQVLQNIEKILGRIKSKNKVYSDRIIDIDILD